MKNIIVISLLTILLFSTWQCSNPKTDNSNDILFQLVPSEKTGIDFQNELPISIDLNIFNYMYYYNGSGLAVGDLNKDGWTDIIFSSNLDKEKVYLNQGDLNFKDVSEIVGVDGGPNSWTNGVALADVNGDGWLDIYLSQVGAYRHLDCTNKLFICQGVNDENIPLYTEMSKEYGLDFKGLSTQAGFFDYDLDGDLDMYLMNHSLHQNGTFGKREKYLHEFNDISGDRLYRNDGGHFTDVSRESGIYSSVLGYGLGLAFGDVNRDGYPDIYVGNDFHENDYLYINQKDGTFKDQLTEQIKHTSRFSMGVDMADINNDQWIDILSLDMLPEDPYILKTSEAEDALGTFIFKLGYGYNHQYAKNNLQINQGDDHFKEIGAYAGIDATDWSWTPLFFDFDMDGHKDLFVSNGIPKRMNDIDYINFITGNDIQYKIQFDHLEETDLSALKKIPEIKIKNKFFAGNDNLVFTDMKDQIDHQVSYSNSAAYADLDNDGDYDLICNNINDKAFIYENKLNKKNSIEVVLNGQKPNVFGIGSTILAYRNGEITTMDYFPSRGFQSSMINQILLPSENLDSIRVVWSDKKSELKLPDGEKQITFNNAEATGNYVIHPRKNIYNIKDITVQTGLGELKHKENPFVEFDREPLIPFGTSAEGPALAVGDVNGDGLDDFYLGSSKFEHAGLYVQNASGQFDPVELIGEKEDSIYEETDAVFADIDGDKDQDLIVVTGGDEFRLNTPYTAPLLYKNENGILKKDTTVFQKVRLTASSLAINDIDNDGDIDIFMGARANPWEYGTVPQSYLLENDGTGHFTDISTQWMEGLDHIGLVKDAQWIDMDADGQKDLVLALEWDRINILYKKGKQLKPDAISKTGLWNSITVADFNGDGHKDIFAGNLGLNARLKSNGTENVEMYVGDFDDNGVKEQILTYFVQGRKVPFHNMMELQKQLAYIKKDYLYAKDFGKASVEELIKPEKLKKAIHYTAEQMANSIFLNNGDGTFSNVELPNEMQWTSYYCAWVEDLDGDGDLDILPGGNYHHCNVQMGRYDAENGSILLNDGKGHFEYKNLEGGPMPGQTKHISPITINGNRAVIVAQNNGHLKILSFD